MKEDLPVPFDTKAVSAMTVHEIRDLISEIERVCMETGEKVDIPTTHHFSDGVYAREMTMPPGALLVGKIHKKTNLNILSSGKVSVLSVDGVKTVEAPHTFVASQGAKRVIFAHSEVVWTTIHGTHETDLDKIEDEFIAKSYDEIPAIIDVAKEEQKCLG